MGARKLKLGTNSFSYPQMRNFIGTGSTVAQYVRIVDICKVAYWIYARLLPRFLRRSILSSVITNLYFTAGLDGVTLRHLFNTLCVWSGPWVITHECELPSWSTVSSQRDGLSRTGLRLLAAKSCKRVIAISRNAFDTQIYRMEHDPGLSAKIRPKMMILHPPQHVSVDRWEDKCVELDGHLSFVLVGHLFFMKGGREVLTVFDQLLNAGHPIELDVVSRLEVDTWASCTTGDDVRWAREVMSRHPGHIRHHESLSNAEVLDLFRRAHVGLLPSYAESYGYSILEAQSCGCPVISTDIGAMPEINDDSCGWLITLPKRDYGDGRSLGRSRYHTDDGRWEISTAIQCGLRHAILEILARRELVKVRGNEAIARIRRDHDPATHAAHLKQIYLESCP